MDKGKGLAALRIVLGIGFLYAGLEKVFDFAGSGKPFSALGFLAHGTAGTMPGSAADAVVNPTSGFWVGLAANTASWTCSTRSSCSARSPSASH